MDIKDLEFPLLPAKNLNLKLLKLENIYDKNIRKIKKDYKRIKKSKSFQMRTYFYSLLGILS